MHSVGTIAEGRDRPALQVTGQLLDRHLPAPVRRVAGLGEVLDAVVLGNVERVAVGGAVALDRVADPLVARLGKALEVCLPGMFAVSSCWMRLGALTEFM